MKSTCTTFQTYETRRFPIFKVYAFNQLSPKYIFFTLLLLLGFSFQVHSQTILAEWDVNGQTSYGTDNLSPSSQNPNVSVTGFTRGNGVETTGTAADDGWGGNGWDVTHTDAIANNKVITFSISPKPGFAVSFSNIDPFSYRRSGTGPENGRLQYSVNSSPFSGISQGPFNFGSSSAGGAGVTPVLTLNSDADLQNVNSSVDFKIVPYGATSSAGTFYIFDVNAGADFGVNGGVLGSETLALSGFENFLGYASTSQSYVIEGNGLTASPIVLTAPSGFEISSDNISFNSTLSISPTSGDINSTVYVRIAAAASVGSQSGNLTMTGGGFTLAADLKVVLSGVVKPIPVVNVNRGTSFLTIQEAIDDAATVDGDVITVDAGTYAITSTINVNKALTINGPQLNVDPRSAAGIRTPGSIDEAVIDGGGAVGTIFNVTAPGVIINGLEVTNGTGDLIASTAGAPVKLGMEVKYCIVHGSSGDEGVQLRNVDSGSISYNRIYDVAGDGINLCCESTNSEIDNNEIYNSASVDGAISLYNNGPYLNITNNLLQNNTADNGIQIGNKNGSNANSNSAESNNAIVSGNTVIGQVGSKLGIYVNTSRVNVLNNTVNGWESVDDAAIYLRWNIKDVVVSGNTISNSFRGVKVSSGVSAVNAVTLAINQNSIFDNDFGFLNSSSGIVDARLNWWGDNSGPSGEGVGIGDSVSVNVAFCPFLDDVAGTGVAKDCPVKNVDTGESFVTIQSAIDDADTDNGDVITVLAGTYAENIIVNKELDIRGPNYRISPNSGTRVAEAVITVPSSDPTAGKVIEIQSPNVSIDGFYINGDNESLIASAVGNGGSMDAHTGVYAFQDGLVGIKISNNSIKNLNGSGVRLESATNFFATTSGVVYSYNNLVHDNLVDNITSLGVDIRSSVYTKITNNTISNIRYGIYLKSFRVADQGLASDRVIENNTIVSSQFGIWPNLYSATPYQFNNNNISAIADASKETWYGIVFSTVSGSQNFMDQPNLPKVSTPEYWSLTGNIIDGGAADPTTHTFGYWLWSLDNFRDDSEMDHFTEISGGSVSNVDVGVYMHNVDTEPNTSFQVARMGAHAELENITFDLNSGGKGIYLKDDPSWTTGNIAPLVAKRDVKLNVGADVVINSGAEGVIIDGAFAQIDQLANAAFSGQSADYIKLLSNTNSLDATAASFDGKIGATASNTENFAIEDKITHKIDDNALGFVSVKANNDFVTTNTLGIQQGIDAVVAGDTVNVAAGMYDESVNIDKSITLHGPNAGISPNGVNRGAEAILVPSGKRLTIDTENTDVIISGFKLDGTAPITNHNVAFPNTVNVTFKENLVTNSRALYAENKTSWESLTVTDNKFTDINISSGASALFLSSIPNVTVTDNSFSDVAYAAMIIHDSGTSGAVTVSGNSIDGTGAQGIQVSGVHGNATVINNKINDANRVSQAADRGAIRLYGSDFTGIITISNNEITGGYNGITVKDGEDITGKNISITENSITGLTSGKAIYHGGTGELSATCNWFGTTDPMLINSQVSGDVSFLSFISIGTDNDLNVIGFQPVSGSCNGYGPVIVYEGSTATVRSSHMTIQGAIDDVNTLTGDRVWLSAGTYSENVFTSFSGKQVDFDGELDASQNPLAIIKGNFSLDNADGRYIKNLRFEVDASELLTLKNTNDLDITNCIFDGNILSGNSGEFLSGKNGINHVSGPNGNSDVTVKDCRFINGLYVGINSRITNLSVVNSVFENIKSGINQMGGDNLSVTNSTFNLEAQAADSDTYGIRFASSATEDLTVSGCEFNVNKNSFVATGSDYHAAIIIRADALGTMVVSGSSVNADIVNLSSVPLTATCNWYGTTDALLINEQISGDVTFLPFLTNGTDDDMVTLGFQPVAGSCDGYGPVIVYEGSTTTVRSSHMTIQEAIDAATANDVIEIGVSSHTEGQIVVNKSLTIQGQGSSNTTVHSSYNTLTSSHANDASAWIRTTAGTTVNIKNLTLDALGMTTHAALRFQSDGSVEGVAFNEIKSAPVNGIAIQIVNGNVDIENSIFTNIGRIGAHFRSGVIPAATISGSFKNNTYTGKGAGNWLDYALDISGGVDPLLVEGNTITNNLGIAESDGSTSAGILVTSYFPLPSNSVANNVTIQGNTLSGNYAGVTAGYLAGDISVLKIEGNDIVGNTYGVTTKGPLVNAAKNYWGSADGPSGSGSGSGNSIAAGIDACPFYNAPVVSGTLVDCPVLNTNTSESFVSIQAAIDDSDTENGDVITVAAGTYSENVVVNKEVVIQGANVDTDCSGSRNPESIISVASGLPFNITADNVVINGFEITAPASSNAVVIGKVSNASVVYNNIHDVGTSFTGGNIHAVIYTVGSTNNSVINISDNCINDISSTSLTGYSSSAIGVLQSTSTGVLTGLDIKRNIISNVTVNDGGWPTGKIAYGIQINVGGNSNYLTNTGKVVNASISNNEISNISGFVATAIALEGNTEDAIVTGNKVSNLTSTKSSDRAGGGYDLNGLKFENNAFVSTVTVENNSFETTSFTNVSTSNLGYGVVNYVPGTTATLGCNWFGTAVYNEIEDNGIAGKVLSKATADIVFSPYLTDGGDGAGIGFQPTGDCSGSPLVIASAVASPELCKTKGSVELTFTGGTAPFAFSWTGGGSASDVTSPYSITELDAGTYTVTITDDNGSSVTTTTEVLYHPVVNVTSSTSYASIQDAIDGATDSDEIEVCEGTYNESLIVPIALSLVGPNAGTSGCDSRGTEATINGYIKVTSSDVSINGFRLLDGANAPAGELAAVHIVSALSNVSILNNYIERTGVLDFDVSRGVVNEIGGTTNLTVSNNYFTGWHTGTYLQNADADVTNNCYVLNEVGISSDTPIDVLVDGNDILNNAFEGVGIGGTVGQMTISNNNITGNLDGVHNYSSSEVNAGSNWWGDAAGPSDFGPGTGDKVSANVNFCPLLNDEVGKGSAVDCRVLNISNGESFVSIQSAIDDAETSTGDTLVAESGTYNENVVVNKELVILGANVDTDCAGRSGESIVSVASGLPFNITADNVVINGFEITAPASSNAVVIGKVSNASVVYNNIHDVGTSFTGGNIHAVIYTVGSTNNSDINISDNCINDISSTSLTGYSSSAIGVLQSTSTGVLTGLDIKRNIISNVTVNDGGWPTGKIAYGIQINVGGNSNYLTNTGKVVNASISNNEISNISGFVATAIALEGNTEDAIVAGNKVSNLTSTKSSDRAGGGYDLNGLKFENNAFVSTVTVENNSFDVSSFTNVSTSNLGYGVVNYVPGTTATLGCNWFGTAVYNEIEDNGITGKVLSKATANIVFSPYLTDGGDGAGIGFQPTGDCSGSPLAIASAIAGPVVCAEKGLIDITFSGGVAPFDFSWTGGGSASDVTSPYSITGLDAGTYTVTVSDNNGSSATATVEVILYPIPEVPIIETDNSELCKGESAVLTATCSSSTDIFRWTTPGVNEGNGVSSLTNTGALTVQKAGTYSGYCETINGCTSEVASVVINEKSNCGSGAFISITPELPAICPGGSIDLTATGCSGVLTWYAGAASPVTGSTVTLSPAETTSYFVSCSSGGSTTVDVRVAEQNVSEIGKITTGKARVKAADKIESTKIIGDSGFTPAPNVIYEAGGSIELKPGFTTEHSTVFRAEIKVCD